MGGRGFRGSWICTGHVEKTNDRDYEVEERYGSWIQWMEQRLYKSVGERLLNGLLSRQAVPHHGVRCESTTKRSEGILGLVTRYAGQSDYRLLGDGHADFHVQP